MKNSTSFADHFHVRLFEAASLTITPENWRVQNVHDSFWRLYLNTTDGAAAELAGGEMFPFLADKLYCVPARVRFNCVAAGAIVHFYLHFDVLGLSEELHRSLFSRPFEAPMNEAIRGEIADLSTRLTLNGSPGEQLGLGCRLKSLVYMALAGYLAALPQSLLENAAAENESYKPLRPALRAIEENLAGPLSIGMLAQKCHYSEDYFIRRFRQSQGRSPIRYIQERRVAWAAQQLLFSDASIDEIAATAGFGNRFYFSRIFSRHLGVSPAAYRRAERL